MVDAETAGAAWLDDDPPPREEGFVVRKATPGEILQAFGAAMTHIVGVANGLPVAMVSLKRLDARLWGMLTMMHPPAHKDRFAIVRELRRGLRDLGEDLDRKSTRLNSSHRL